MKKRNMIAFADYCAIDKIPVWTINGPKWYSKKEAEKGIYNDFQTTEQLYEKFKKVLPTYNEHFGTKEKLIFKPEGNVIIDENGNKITFARKTT